MRRRFAPFGSRSMARRPGARRMPLSPRALAMAGWLIVILVVLGIALAVRILGGNGDGSTADPTPSGSGATAGLTIAFGTALDNGRQVVSESATRTFTREDTFAYSVGEAAAAREVYVEVRRVAGGPVEVVQAPVEAQAIPGAPAPIGFTVPAGALLDAFGPGTFEMRIFLDPAGTAIAAGRFTLVEAVAPSASSP